MDDDRVKGSAQKLKGDFKESAGRALGDSKLESEGRADQAGGRLRNAIGGLKDAFRNMTRGNRPGERDRRS